MRNMIKTGLTGFALVATVAAAAPALAIETCISESGSFGDLRVCFAPGVPKGVASGRLLGNGILAAQWVPNELHGGPETNSVVVWAYDSNKNRLPGPNPQAQLHCGAMANAANPYVEVTCAGAAFFVVQGSNQRLGNFQAPQYPE